MWRFPAIDTVALALCWGGRANAMTMFAVGTGRHEMAAPEGADVRVAAVVGVGVDVAHG